MFKLLSLFTTAALSFLAFSAKTTITNAADLAKALKSLPLNLVDSTYRQKSAMF